MPPRRTCTKAPVHYESASEDLSVAGNKGRRGKKAGGETGKPSLESRMTKKASVPLESRMTKKASVPLESRMTKKRSAPDTEDTDTASSSKRRKVGKSKDSKVLQEVWATYLNEANRNGELLDHEPPKEHSITQSDAIKNHGLKKEELVVLRHFEKKNPLYGGVMKLYWEDEVRRLGIRKLGVLVGGVVTQMGVMAHGTEIWKEQEKEKSEREKEAQRIEKLTPEEKENDKLAKELWAVYLASNQPPKHMLFRKQPEKEGAILLTAAKEKYGLTTPELMLLPHFLKKNNLYKNVAKIFVEKDVARLAKRKKAVMAGEDGKKGSLIGKELWEKGWVLESKAVEGVEAVETVEVEEE